MKKVSLLILSVMVLSTVLTAAMPTPAQAAPAGPFFVTIGVWDSVDVYSYNTPGIFRIYPARSPDNYYYVQIDYWTGHGWVPEADCRADICPESDLYPRIAVVPGYNLWTVSSDRYDKELLAVNNRRTVFLPVVHR